MQERLLVWADRHSMAANTGLCLSGIIFITLLNERVSYQSCCGPWSLIMSLEDLSSHPNSKNRTWNRILFCLPGTSAGQQNTVWLWEFACLLALTTLRLQLPWPGMWTETQRKSPRSLEAIKRKPSVPYLAGWNFFPGTKSERKDWFLEAGAQQEGRQAGSLIHTALFNKTTDRPSLAPPRSPC